MNKKLLIIPAAALTLALTGCKDDDPVLPADYTELPEAVISSSPYKGLYVVNEGNMGSNKCTLDYLDFTNGIFARNIFPERNPGETLELGDSGNDLLIRDGRMYIAVSGSNKLEVLNANTAQKIGQVDIPNCRYIEYADGNIYVTSYTGGFQIDPTQKRGTLYRIDASTLTITAHFSMVYWPEEMAVVGDKLYVATSGSAVEGDYPDNSVMEIDLATFTVSREIPVGTNLHHIKADDAGHLWVSGRGDYGARPSRLYRLSQTDGKYSLDKTVDVACSNFTIDGNIIYLYASEWSYETNSSVISYSKVDASTASVMSGSFIASSEISKIATPYAILVNPYTKDIYLTDAKNYVSSGALHCIGQDGKIKWSVNTGDIPGHMAFLKK